MLVGCPQCEKRYRIPDERIAGKRVRTKCRHCGHSFIIDGTSLDTKKAAPVAAVPQQPQIPPSSKEGPRKAAVAKAPAKPAARRPVPAPTPIKAPRAPAAAKPPAPKLQKAPAPPRRPDPPQVQARPQARRAVPDVELPTLDGTIGPGDDPTQEIEAPQTQEAQDAHWFAGVRGNAEGPMPARELRQRLKSGDISPATPVWHEGMEAWKPADEVESLGSSHLESSDDLPAGMGYTPDESPADDTDPPSSGDFENSSMRRREGASDAPAALGEASAPPADFDPQIPKAPKVPRLSGARSAASQALRSVMPSIQGLTSNRRIPIWGYALVAAGVAFGATLGVLIGIRWLFPQLIEEPRAARSSDKVELAANTPMASEELYIPEDTPEEATIPEPEAKRGRRRGHAEARQSRDDNRTDDTGADGLSAAERARLAQFNGSGGMQGGFKAPGPNGNAKQGEGLNSAQLSKVVSKNRPALSRCYERVTRGRPDAPRVRMDIEVAVGGSGVVTKVSSKGSADEELKRCVLKTVKRWRFPSARSSTSVAFPVVFTPGA